MLEFFFTIILIPGANKLITIMLERRLYYTRDHAHIKCHEFCFTVTYFSACYIEI